MTDHLDNKTNVIDTLVSFDQDESEDKLIIKRTQEIPDDWRMDNRKIREDSVHRRTDWEPVASIPVEVADFMLRVLGYDVTREPFRKTISMLKQHGLDDFILTNKSL